MLSIRIVLTSVIQSNIDQHQITQLLLNIIDKFIILTKRNMKTMSRFVLIDNSNKRQIFLEWKNKYNMNKTEQNKFTSTGMNYSARKTLISDLNPLKQERNTAATKHLNKDIRTTASTNNLMPFIYSNPQRQNNSNHNPHRKKKVVYRTRSVGRITRMSQADQDDIQSKRHEQNIYNAEKLRNKIIQADQRKGRTICVIKARRDGLRYKVKYQFFIVHSQMNHQDFARQVKEQMFQQFNHVYDKRVYLFHLGKQPINKINDNLNERQFVIFSDVNPKFDIPFDLQMKLFEQASFIEQKIKEATLQLQKLKKSQPQGIQMQTINTEQQSNSSKKKNQIYEWQKIKDVKKYVQKLINHPQEVKKLNRESTQKDEVQLWYEQKRVNDQLKKTDKNPFFDVQCHFPKQTAKIQILTQAANRVAQLPLTINKHELKNLPIQNMMEKIKRQNQIATKLKKQEQDRVRILGYKSQKQVLKNLDRKNIPLTYQNIPFMMEKYGINRAQIYNLFNLYKSLQKVSAMRMFNTNEHRRVVEKGIDRKTFDQGLKGLEINPGDQLVRNICYFPDFITWEQFIKIVSISMRKTPQSKLQAILQGLGSSDRGYLTRQQVDIMVGSSLQKIFGVVEVELRKYFVSLVMKQFDTDKSGTIQISQIRDHVLTKGIEDLDLVSYLMLNS